MKAIIFDSSTLISIAMNGLFSELKELRKIFNGKFLITKEVKEETIDRPLTIKKFELEGLRIKELLDEKILEMPDSLGIDNSRISDETRKVLNTTNRIFSARGRDINLINSGEASCLALSRILSEREIKNIITVDERTTRMLGEKPENLKKLFENKLHTNIYSRKENYVFFKNFKFIRSTELIYVAYKKNLTKLGNGVLLDALLYALKFKGCAISEEEINEIKNL